MHLISATESLGPPDGGAVRFGWWGGLAWFVVAHLDVRADLIRRSSANSSTTDTFLIQLNGYL